MLEENEQQLSTQQGNHFDATPHIPSAPADPSNYIPSPSQRSFSFSSLVAYYRSQRTRAYPIKYPSTYTMAPYEIDVPNWIPYRLRGTRRPMISAHSQYASYLDLHQKRPVGHTRSRELPQTGHEHSVPDPDLSQKWMAHLRGKPKIEFKQTPETDDPPRQLISFGHTVCVAGVTFAQAATT